MSSIPEDTKSQEQEQAQEQAKYDFEWECSITDAIDKKIAKIEAEEEARAKQNTTKRTKLKVYRVGERDD